MSPRDNRYNFVMRNRGELGFARVEIVWVEVADEVSGTSRCRMELGTARQRTRRLPTDPKDSAAGKLLDCKSLGSTRYPLYN